MSTSETLAFEKGPCPCGAGHIAQHVTTQDNPWSTADIHYTIECPRCSNEWRLEGAALVLRSSESSYLEAKAAESTTSRPLQQLLEQLVSDYFAGLALPTKKAEHAEMARLDITALSYSQYLKHRRSGGALTGACYGLRNEAWLQSLAAAQAREAALEQLVASNRLARQAVDDAASAIVRRSID